MESETVYRIAGRDYDCPLHLALSAIMGKWKGLVVFFLSEHKSLRYGELRRLIAGYVRVTDKMLIQSLREMERDGLITRKVFTVVPPRVDYALTDAGRRLLPAIEALEAFGETYAVASGLKATA
jgi:DNA-binding HxlR family transcriptional regulator